MPSEPPATVCPRCGRRFEAAADEPHRCPCGGPLELDWSPTAPALDRPVSGLWDLAAALPPGPTVHLGAGGTPAVRAAAFDASFKLETCNPTGSFKDRGAATTLSRAAALGVESVREDSSGNAGRAIAAYAARAGLDARVFVPADAPSGTLAAIRATGAVVESVAGDREAVTAACVADGRGWYASHAWRPAFYAGTATLAYELVAERGGTAPDAVVLPVGHGTLLLGLHRGFRALERAGRLPSSPALYAVQLADGGSLLTGSSPSVDVATGIHVPRPARADALRGAIERTGGDVVGVEADAVRDCRDRLARAGFDVGSTAAAGVRGRESLRETGTLDATADVVVPLTGRSRDR